MTRSEYVDKRFSESKIPIVLIFLGVFVFFYLIFGGSYAAFKSHLIGFDSFRSISISLIIIFSLIFFLWLFIGKVRVAIETLWVVKKISINDDFEFLIFIGVTKKVDKSSIKSIIETRPINGFWSMSLLSKQYKNYEILLADNKKFMCLVIYLE